MEEGGALVMTSGATTFSLDDDAFTWTPDRSNIKTLLKRYGSDNTSRQLSQAQEDLLLVEGNQDGHDYSNKLTITADNNLEELYVNGVRVGIGLLPNRNDWTRADIINNLNLNPGLNVIAMRVYNTGGPDGVFANLEFHKGSRQSLNENAVAVYQNIPNWYAFDYDDSAWPDVVKRHNYGNGPWGTQIGALDNFDIDSAWSWSSGATGQVARVYIRWHVYVDEGGWTIKLASLPNNPVDTDDAKRLVNLYHLFGISGTHTFSQETLDFTDRNYDTGNYLTGIKSFGIGDDEQTERFGMVAKSTITVPRNGWYSFGLTSDDGSILRVNSQTVVSYEGYHPASASPVGQIYLSEGVHPVEVVYFEGSGVATLEVFYATGYKWSFNSTDFSLLRGGQVL